MSVLHSSIIGPNSSQSLSSDFEIIECILILLTVLGYSDELGAF